MSEDFDILIKRKESELHALRSQMQTLQLRFMNDTSKFAAKWYDETARQYVAKFSERTLSLSRESLAQMKTEVNALIKNADSTVKNALSSSRIWWHVDPRLHDSFFLYEQLGDGYVGNRFPEIVDKPVRSALGQLGTILEKFGYNVTTKVSLKSTYPEFWFGSTEDKYCPAGPYFPHLMEWSEDMQETMREYNELFKKAIVLLNEIEKIKDEKKKREVMKMWDSTV